MNFLDNFDWADTLLTENEKHAVEEILVDCHDISARHRMDIGMKIEFKVKLTPKDDKGVYSQNLPNPIYLVQNLILQLVLIHKYGILTVLPFSKHANPIFVQRKYYRKIRLLVDLTQINTLIKDDYTNYTNFNHPASTLLHAAQHLAGNSLFCKHDCSQAYHCLQMTDQRSVGKLAFTFASRTFAYKNLHNVYADLCLHFQAACASSWTQLLRLINTLNTWTLLELQPTPLRILSGIFGQSSTAFAKQD